MKSLEIVNKQIKFAKDYEYTQVVLSMDSACEIKQDLEVLEIIKNKRVNLEFLRTVVVKLDNLDEMLEMYNTAEWQYCLTMEELLKLKKWLEVNE